jgi:glycosyltransferase involved in cell wall biosynthesis
MSPKLSVITINLNNADGLHRTIESVSNQTFKDFEFIIIDGGSTDASKEVITKYSQQITYWVSEKDTGIYNAMNKGIVNAKGEYLHFLNSGDFLYNQTVYADLFSNDFNEDIIYGNRVEINSYGKNKKLNRGLHKSALKFKEVYDESLFHTCTFIKRRLFNNFGLYDENFKIVSDYGFFLNAIGLHSVSVRYIDLTVSYFDMSGISKNPAFSGLREKEAKEIRQKLLSPLLVEYLDEIIPIEYDVSRIRESLLSRILYRLSIFISKNLSKRNIKRLIKSILPI